MPHHKSAAKRVITNAKANQRNTAARTRVRKALKAVTAASGPDEARAAYRRATSVLDRVAAKGIIKKETANRRKARLARIVQRLPA